MSRDIFVQDLPPTITSVAQIPNDFEPRSIGSRSQIIAVIGSVVPKADCSDPSWVVIDESPVFHIEVNLGETENLAGFAFHVSGGAEADRVVSRILDALHLRALDPASDSGLFESPHA